MINIKSLFLFIVIFILMLQPVSAEIYKWVDSDGEVHFSDSAPWENEVQGDIEQIETQYDDYSYTGEYSEEEDDADVEEMDGEPLYDHGPTPFFTYREFRIHSFYSSVSDNKHMRYLSHAVENLQDQLYKDGFRVSDSSKQKILSFRHLGDNLRQILLTTNELTVYKGRPRNVSPVYMILYQKKMLDSKGKEMIRVNAQALYYFTGDENAAIKNKGIASDYFHELTLWSIKDRQKICKLIGGYCYKKKMR